MTLQQLEYVIALDTYQHFVTAAEKCKVTQPTLSMQVQKLEDEIGIRIFDRSKKPLSPTKVGEQFISRAKKILKEVDQLKDFVDGKIETVEGKFTLGIIPTLSPFLLPLFRLYRPELIIVSAGFDSARGDPLGGCDLTPKGYARLLHI